LQEVFLWGLFRLRSLAMGFAALLTSPLRAAALRGEVAPAGAGEGLIVNATDFAPAQTLTRRWRADLSL